jgi:hypothetical protein
MAEFGEIPLISLGKNKAIYGERELPLRQYEYATAFAFDRIRASGLVPAALIDLIEKFEERTRVKVSFHRTQDGARGNIQVRGPRIAPHTRVHSSIAALKRISREPGLNWFTASEATALFLRVILRRHKTTTKPSPVRSQGVVSKRIISDAAIHLLNLCFVWNYAPGPMLRDLFRELLNVEGVRTGAPRRADARWRAVRILAEQPDISSRKLAEDLGVHPTTVTRWRKNSSFIAEVERTSKS